MSEKYVLAFLLQQRLSCYASFTLAEIVEKFIDPCNGGPMLTSLNLESHYHGIPKVIFDSLFWVLKPLDETGNVCVLMLVNIEIQRKFRIAGQNNLMRCRIYLNHMELDVRGRLRSEMQAMAAYLHKTYLGITLAMPKFDELHPYTLDFPCQSFWAFMHPPRELRDTVRVFPPSEGDARNSFAAWPDGIQALETDQAHLICAAPPKKGDSWTSVGNMLYALLSPRVDNDRRLSILQNDFGFEELDFIRERGDEYMTSAEDIMAGLVDDVREEFQEQLDESEQKAAQYKQEATESEQKAAQYKQEATESEQKAVQYKQEANKYKNELEKREQQWQDERAKYQQQLKAVQHALTQAQIAVAHEG